MHYPVKISTTCTIIEEELKDAFQTIASTWLQEVNWAKLENLSPSQFSLLKSFITKYGQQFPNVAQLLQILLPRSPDISPVMHGYTYLEKVASKKRNHLKLENLEKFFLLKALKMSIKSATSYQAERKHLEEA